MSSKLSYISVAGSVLLALPACQGAGLANDAEVGSLDQALTSQTFHDDFSSGLGKWETSGTVNILNGAARVRGAADMEAQVPTAGASQLQIQYTRRTVAAGTVGIAEVSTDGGATYSEIDRWSNTEDERMSVAVATAGATGDELRLRYRCNDRFFLSDQCLVDDVAVVFDCEGAACAPVNVDPLRSLLVSDLAVIGEDTEGAGDFTLERTLEQLGQPLGKSATDMFVSLWETMRSVDNGGRCEPTLNGYEQQCRPSEGNQINSPADAMARYRATALVNRLDLTSGDASDCGEFRIIYARRPGFLGVFDRSLINFEARMPNPTPGDPASCLPIQEFWAALTSEPDASLRAQQLEEFYYEGLPGFPPAISLAHFSEAGSAGAKGGQVRLNLFMTELRGWVLKELKLDTSVGFKPVFVRSNPVGFLFDEEATSPVIALAQGPSFRANFLRDMESLVRNPTDINAFALTDPSAAHNNNQSHSQDIGGNRFADENRYREHASAGFRVQIQDRLDELNSELSVDQVLNRAVANTCGGCHKPSVFGLTEPDSIGPGMSFPEALEAGGFVHVGDRDDGLRFPISPALQDVFLPARKRLLDGLLNEVPEVPWAPALFDEGALPAGGASQILAQPQKREG